MAIEDTVTREYALGQIGRGYWSGVTSSDLIQRCARLHPEKVALVDSRHRLTYAELDALADQVALTLLDLGVRQGDVVVGQLPTCVEHMAVFLATQRMGAVRVFVMMTLRASEMKFVLDYTQARVAIVPDTYRRFDHAAMIAQIRPELPHLEHVIVTGESVPAGMLSFRELTEVARRKGPSREYLSQFKPEPWYLSDIYTTTGTTGAPKFALFRDCMPYGRVLAERSAVRPDDVFMAMAPLNAGAATPCRLTAPWSGCKVVLQEVFEPEETLALIEREKVTFACGVPAQIAKMLDVPGGDKYDLSSLRVFMYGGAVLPPEIGRALVARTGCRILTHYGGLDAGIFAANSIYDEAEETLTTVGQPMVGVDLRMLDDNRQEVPLGEVGEIAARGPNIRAGGGYYKDPEANARAVTADGWYLTGDMGVQYLNGAIAIVGRKKDMIIRGGQNISPKEVEDLLCGHPCVAEVSIVAMPDRVMGEKACAFVVPRQGQSFTFEEMVSFLKGQNIAMYKLPERLEIIDRLPMVGDGQKVNKMVLRQAVEQKLKEEEGNLSSKP